MSTWAGCGRHWFLTRTCGWGSVLLWWSAVSNYKVRSWFIIGMIQSFPSLLQKVSVLINRWRHLLLFCVLCGCVEWGHYDFVQVYIFILYGEVSGCDKVIMTVQLHAVNSIEETWGICRTLWSMFCNILLGKIVACKFTLVVFVPDTGWYHTWLLWLVLAPGSWIVSHIYPVSMASSSLVCSQPPQLSGITSW